MRWLVLTALIVGCGGPREPQEAPSAAPPAAAPEPETERELPPESAVPVAAPAELPNSDVPQNARLVASTARPGLIAFSNALENRGSLWVGQLAGNGGRDTVIFLSLIHI